MNNPTDPSATSDPTATLAATLDPSPEELERLTTELADKALAQHDLDVAYTLLDSPVGRLLVAATELGLVRVAFEREDLDRVRRQLADTVSPRLMRAPRRLDPAARALDEYFAGRRTAFDLPLDLRLSTGFRGEVRAHLAEIAYGHTASYAELAGLAGRPRAVRAAASACATNPLPIVVACHRVVRSDGSLSGYLGGVEAKRALLDLERRVAGTAPGS